MSAGVKPLSLSIRVRVPAPPEVWSIEFRCMRSGKDLFFEVPVVTLTSHPPIDPLQTMTLTVALMSEQEVTAPTHPVPAPLLSTISRVFPAPSDILNSNVAFALGTHRKDSSATGAATAKRFNQAFI